MAGRYIRPSYQYFDNSGRVLDSGKLFFYDSGTTTLKNVYSDPDGLTAIANPVVLDGAGRTPNVYLDGSYKLIIKDKNGAQIEERDPVLAADDTTKGFSSWNAVTTYSVDDIVRGSNNLLYISITSSNQNNDPTSSAVNWTEVQFLSSYNVNETYSIGDVIINSVGDIYKSLTNSNTGNTPGASPSNWTSVVAGTFATVDIDGGTIDGTVIGGATPAAASVTTLDVSSTLGVTGETTFAGKQTSSGIVRNTTAQTYEAGVLGYTTAGFGFIFRPPQAGASAAHVFEAFDGTDILKLTEAGNAEFAGSATVTGGLYTNGFFTGATLGRFQAAGVDVDISIAGGVGSIGTQGAQSFALQTNNTDRFTIDGSGNAAFAGDVDPAVTETQDLGSASLEWDNLYVQNSPTVSDERYKNDLGALDDKWVAMFDSLSERIYSLKSREIVAAKPPSKGERQKTKTIQVEKTSIEIVNGEPIQKTELVDDVELVFDHIQVKDSATGELLFKDIPAVTESVLNEDGEPTGEVVEIEPARREPLTHPVPVMEEYDIPAEEAVFSSHGRPHTGFMAQAVKQAMTDAGIDDWAGYAYDEEADKHMLRLQEFIAPLLYYVKEKTTS